MLEPIEDRAHRMFEMRNELRGWARDLMVNREGAARGRMIICAIASDTPDDCK